MMGNGFSGAGMWLFGLLTLVGVALLVVVLVRVLGAGIARPTPTSGDFASNESAGPPRRSRAREILDERYARGELTTEEYRERLQALESQ
jgi:putative membrane protein